MSINIQMNDRQLREFMRSITVLPRVRKKNLLRDVGLMAQNQMRAKIARGAFKAPSKWVVAKKNRTKALVGVARKVFAQKISDNEVHVDTKDPRFSLADHQKGWTIPAGSGGPEDRVYGDWVVLPLKRPSALNKPVTNPFIYKWTTNKRPSVVPPRDVIPSERRLVLRSEMIAKRWAEKLIKEALGRAGKVGVL